MTRTSILQPLSGCAGWHPLGLLGIAAALAGALLIGHVISSGVRHPADAANVVAISANTQLENQRATLAERLSRFPSAEQRAAQIAAVDALATECGVVIGSGEYRNAPSPMPGELAMLEVQLPLQGPPMAVRAFVAGLQRDMPWLTIDHLLLERDGNAWRGEVRGRLFLRESA